MFQFDESLLKEKRHIIITGNRGAGKSTLLAEIVGKLGGSRIPGLTTRAVRMEAVYMRKNGTDEEFKIGEYDPDIVGKENLMRPVYEGFLTYGAKLLAELMEDSSEWVSIDEIGYLETQCEDYLDQPNALFACKRMIAVVRKQNLPYLTDLCNREDALLIDLDERGQYGKDYLERKEKSGNL